jgi:CRP-like cAMP-binding protein
VSIVVSKSLILERVGWTGGLSVSQATDLASFFELKEAKLGDVVASGRDRRGILVLFEGSVKTFVRGVNGEYALGDYRGNGTPKVITDTFSCSFAVVTSDAIMFFLPADKMGQAMSLCPSLLPLFMHEQAMALGRVQDQLVEALELGAKERVIKRLRQEASKVTKNEGTTAVVRFTHDELAKLSWTSRETTSRILSGLHLIGATKRAGNGKILVNLDKLPK